MKIISFDQASTEFQRMFQLAASGETIVIERDDQRVALQRLSDLSSHDIAPPGYFHEDYSSEEIEHLNHLGSHGPQNPLP